MSYGHTVQWQVLQLFDEQLVQPDVEPGDLPSPPIRANRERIFSSCALPQQGQASSLSSSFLKISDSNVW